MNVFVLSSDPVEAARMLCDRHVVKMCLESTQILSTVLWKMGHMAPMRPTHRNHPCTVWAGSTSSNFEWLLIHGLAIFDEYTFRYGRIHASRWKIEEIAADRTRPPVGPLTDFVQAVAKVPGCVGPDPVAAYRTFYVADKWPFARWARGRSAPIWWKEMTGDGGT